jgi:Nuclease-related domain
MPRNLESLGSKPPFWLIWALGLRDDTLQVVTGVDAKPPRRLRLRYPATCTSCGISLSKGSEAFWDAAGKTVTCLACFPDRAVDSGVAGASAAAAGNRRAERKVDEVRQQYGDHAAVVAQAMASHDASATWGKGSDGESRLASYIAGEVGDRVIALHDRLIPGTRGNIDLIYVAPTGVWVVDAKAYKGKLVQRQIGPLWKRDNKVFVDGKDRTSLARGVDCQVAAVKAAVKSDESLSEVDVFGVLCFVESDWGLLDFPFSVGATWVTYPGALRKQLGKDGSLSRAAMERIGRRLDLSLPTAR